MPFDLADTLEFLRAEVAPRAAAFDRDPEALEQGLRLLGSRGLLALRAPAALGGPDVSPADYGRFQEGLARASGALAFLQTQHQSAAAMLAASDAQGLAQAYVPHMGSGARRLGIGFGHLRRPGPPPVTAREVEGGYRFAGELPWVTGQGFFPEFVGAAALPDGSAVFAVLPLVDGAGVRVGPPAELAVMEVTRTVNVRLDDLLVPRERVVALQPPGWIAEVDRRSVRARAHQALGCARAALDALAAVAARSSGAPAALAALEAELEACRRAVFEEQGDALEVRAHAIELAARAGHAAVTAAAGSGLLRERAAQRIYREALAYTVLGQSPAVRDATLARLARR
ncbi:MAG: acyl-CoA dehydrogenase family protein [Planctomycetota bacterium]